MSLQLAAQHLASKGRDGDSVLVHMTPGEVRGLQELAVANGGELTINPETGLPEANFLKALLPTIIGAALAPLTAGTSLAFLGTPLGAGLAVGGVEALRTGDLGKGLMAGFGAYGGANLASALTNVGGAGLQAAAAAPSVEAIKALDAAAAQGMAFPVDVEATKLLQQQVAEKTASLTPYDKLSAGLSGLKTEAGRSALVNALGGPAGAVRTAAGIAGPIAAAQDVQSRLPKTVTQMTSPTARITPYEIDEYGNLRRAGSYTPQEFVDRGGFASLYGGPPPGAAGGGLMSHLADGGTPYDEDFAFAQRSEPVVRMANGGFTDERVAQALRESMGQGFTLEQSLGGAASKFGISQDQLTRAQALLNPTTANPFKASREDVLAAYKANPLAELNPNEEAINYWRTQGLGSFDDVVKSARAENPGLAAFIDASRNPAVTTAATTPFATAETTLPNYLGLNAVATGAPTTFVSSSAPAGYDYSAAQIKTQNEQAVNEIYNRVLGRQAEQEGLNYWTGLLDQGANLSDVESQIKNVASNIGVKVDPTQLATPTAAQRAAQESILADPVAAALAAVRSGIQAGMTDQQIADMVNMQYGKSFSAQNVADFMKAQGITRPPTTSTATDVTYGGDTVIPPYVAPQPDVTLGTPFQPKAQTMNEVRTAYEQGGGSTRMPTITDIRPTDRMYSQGQAVELIRGYLKSNPNAMYRDVVAFANSRGIPEMQARAAYNEFRFTDMSPGMQGIYDYLMGRGPAPIKPYVPGGGPIMRSYREVMGIPSTYQDLKPVNLTGNQDAVSKGVPKEVPSVKDPSGKQYPDLAAFYFNANPDVQKAYETDPQAKTMKPEDYVAFHWNNFGQKEKRPGYYEELVAKPATYEGGGGASGGMAQDIPRMARGGLSSLAILGAAKGGGFNLGDYSDGGRLLRGPGDGVSDSIPATIGGKRPARLADGEFVVPARIVSELGNGSTEAGARKLYAMMDRVQRARSKSMGKGKVAKNTRADKYLPA